VCRARARAARAESPNIGRQARSWEGATRHCSSRERPSRRARGDVRPSSPPDVARRIAAEGHLVINHTDDHRSFTGVSTGTVPLTTAERRAELDAAEAAIVGATGTSTKPWFRPPYGDTDQSVERDVAVEGYGYEVLCTVDSLGWKGLTADAIAARCLELAVPGAIYLFHVGAASQDSAALPTMIVGLRQRGYTFVTVARLAGVT
jgi:peptidoglycan-N-acetylglucosamine deacetylase